MCYGVQFDFNYTFSKSIDISSDANRITDEGGLGGQVIKAWDPNSLRAASDFDLRHQINANWIAELPFGKRRCLAKNPHAPPAPPIGACQPPHPPPTTTR